MGQAFDEGGAVLGEAFADTKREVFDKLIREFPHAEEIRIKAMREKLGFVAENQPATPATSGTTAPLDVMDPMLQFFEFSHLPPRLQMVSKPFSDTAHDVVRRLPRNPERTVALRKLLEAKDCAVRAVLYK